MEEEIHHIIPFDDLEPHTEEVDYTRNSVKCHCDCCPHIQKEEDRIIIFHNAYDGREAFSGNINDL